MSNSEQLERALKMINDAAAAGGDFVLDQLPLIAKEIIAWQTWGSAFWVFLSLSVIIYVFRNWKRLSTSEEEDRRWLSDGEALRLTVCIVISVVSVIVFLDKSACLIKAITAPRLVLIEYVKELAK